MDIGDRLREVRQKAGLTQQQFGTAIGVSKNTQTRYEKGQRIPDVAYLMLVAKKFGANFNDLFYGVTDRMRQLLEASPNELVALASPRFASVPHDLETVLSWLDTEGIARRVTIDEGVFLDTYRELDESQRLMLTALLASIGGGKR